MCRIVIATACTDRSVRIFFVVPVSVPGQTSNASGQTDGQTVKRVQEGHTVQKRGEEKGKKSRKVTGSSRQGHLTSVRTFDLGPVKGQRSKVKARRTGHPGVELGDQDLAAPEG
eukprot:2773681-Rhodomonas_salina.1